MELWPEQGNVPRSTIPRSQCRKATAPNRPRRSTYTFRSTSASSLRRRTLSAGAKASIDSSTTLPRRGRSGGPQDFRTPNPRAHRFSVSKGSSQRCTRSFGGSLTNAENQLLTSREIAAILGIRPRTLRLWSRTGNFTPPIRIGRNRRSLRWRVTDVQAYLASQTRQDRPSSKERDITE
jgi:predicted DNA-binding transcriptional regulator AlpA